MNRIHLIAQVTRGLLDKGEYFRWIVDFHYMSRQISARGCFDYRPFTGLWSGFSVMPPGAINPNGAGTLRILQLVGMLRYGRNGEIHEKGKKFLRLKLIKTTRNKEIPEDRFTMSPPEGAKQEEFRP